MTDAPVEKCSICCLLREPSQDNEVTNRDSLSQNSRDQAARADIPGAADADGTQSTQLPSPHARSAKQRPKKSGACSRYIAVAMMPGVYFQLLILAGKAYTRILARAAKERAGPKAQPPRC
jgi:hypothetical protein